MKSVTRYPTPRLATDVIPLTYSQRWTWTFVELDRKPTSRSVGMATRLCGRLDEELLRTALAEVVSRHEALRTRILSVGGTQQQIVDATRTDSLQVFNLADSAPSEREMNARRLAEDLIQEPLEISVGPLFAARLLKLANDEHVLVIAMDHIISDGASIGIVMRDLWTIYAQLRQRRPLSLPRIPVQFADYAVWQHKRQAVWAQKHGQYWNSHLVGATRCSLFSASAADSNAPIKVAAHPIQIDSVLTSELRGFCRQHKSSLAMGVLAAYVASIANWCGQSDVTATLISTGRLHGQVRNTVGYFAAPMYLRVRLDADDNFVNLLRRVQSEYTNAYEHMDSGRVAMQSPRPAFVSNPRFNWIPAEFNVSPTGYLCNPGANATSGLEEHRFETSQRDDFDPRGGGPEMLLSEVAGTISGGIWYRSDIRDADSDIERFELSWRRILQRMVSEAGSSVWSSQASDTFSAAI
jgi:Condensation domain